jgi:ribosomal protein S18 acetylase RimI-like enzyme
MTVEERRDARPYTLRPATEDDEPFLFELYRSTRTAGQIALPLGSDQADVILRMQFTAQNRSYEAEFPTQEHNIILVDGRRVGRVLTAPQERVVRFVDLALLPEYRNTGIATVLIRELMDDVARRRVPALLSVARDHRAIRLYERLGFTVVDESGPSLVMVWIPETCADKNR